MAINYADCSEVINYADYDGRRVTISQTNLNNEHCAAFTTAPYWPTAIPTFEPPVSSPVASTPEPDFVF